MVPVIGFLSLLATHQTPISLTISCDKAGIKISPVFYGLMTEEINHSYDGGLYGELIQNRSFKDGRESPVDWSAIGGATISLDPDAADNPGGTSLKIAFASAGSGVSNSGYWGISVKPKAKYSFSFYAKAASGFSGPLRVAIESAEGTTTIAQAKSGALYGKWRKYSGTLRTGNVAPSKSNRFAVYADSPGTIWLDHVSLFPPTYHNRPNGNRPDLMKLLGDLKPSFLRLPGGNYLEGNTVPERFDWKKTIGPAEDRPGHQGPWGYRSTDGLGLLEYLEWCEDLHMQPLLAVYAGYSLRQDHVEPGTALQPFVQDALDEIEYVTGGTDTKWGSERAKDGHPRPFPLKFVEIGNEDWFDRSRTYPARFAQFYDAIKSKYPALQIISTTPMTGRTPDLVDDHYYRSPGQMERDWRHYDKTPRNGPKIFVGEWASIEGTPTPTMNAALGDAVWLAGLERDSDVVLMESYAPLLVNVNRGASQWGTNLIGYDVLDSFGSPSFYVQALFGANAGDVVLPADMRFIPLFASSPSVAQPRSHGSVGIGTYRTNSEFKDMQVTLGDGTAIPLDKEWTTVRGTWNHEDAPMHQTAMRANTMATSGDNSWTDYTYTLKARKVSGSEGFLVMLHVQGEHDYYQLNVGGWDDTRTAFQRVDPEGDTEIGQASETTVETGKWYDVRIMVKAGHIRGFIDDKLVGEADEAPRPPLEPVYAEATRATRAGEVILKLVNITGAPVAIPINLQGVRSVDPNASGWVLTGSPADVNTVEQPRKVAPQPVKINDAAPQFKYTLPAYSVTVLRIKAK